MPIVKRLIEEEGIGESQGSVGFAEVEFDAPDNGELGMRYMVWSSKYNREFRSPCKITSIPTLLAFSRQEPQIQTKVMNVNDMKNPEFLKDWIESEAARGGQGGAGGGSILSSFFGRGS